MPEPDRSRPTWTAIPLLFLIGHVPFFSGLLGLDPCTSAFPRSGVRSHRTLGALQSRSLRPPNPLCSPSRPVRRTSHNNTPGYNNSAGSSRFSATGTQPGAGAPMNIGAAQQQPRAGNPQCYNCQQFGHIARNCRNKKVPQGQAPQVARVAETPTQQTAGPSNDEHIRALQGMDFEAMKAYFADLKG